MNLQVFGNKQTQWRWNLFLKYCCEYHFGSATVKAILRMQLWWLFWKNTAVKRILAIALWNSFWRCCCDNHFVNDTVKLILKMLEGFCESYCKSAIGKLVLEMLLWKSFWQRCSEYHLGSAIVKAIILEMRLQQLFRWMSLVKFILEMLQWQ